MWYLISSYQKERLKEKVVKKVVKTIFSEVREIVEYFADNKFIAVNQIALNPIHKREIDILLAKKGDILNSACFDYIEYIDENEINVSLPYYFAGLTYVKMDFLNE